MSRNAGAEIASGYYAPRLPIEADVGGQKYRRRMRLPTANSLAGTRTLGARCREHLWTRLVGLVVQAVNQRGLCAVEMTILAELPSEEVELMRKQCSCPRCFAQRAN